MCLKSPPYTRKLSPYQKKEPPKMKLPEMKYKTGNTVPFMLPGYPVGKFAIESAFYVIDENGNCSGQYGGKYSEIEKYIRVDSRSFEEFAAMALTQANLPKENHLTVTMEQLMTMQPCKDGLITAARINGSSAWNTPHDVYELFMANKISTRDAAFLIEKKLISKCFNLSDISYILRYQELPK